MKENTWIKVIAIALAVALVFTIVTSNIVSITAISVLKNAKTGTVNVPDSTPATTGSGDTQPVDNTQGGGETVDQTADTNATTAAGGSSTGTTPGGNTATTKAQGGSSNNNTPASNGLSSKEEVFNFYKAAVLKIKNNGVAGHTRKEWQTIDALTIGGSDKLRPLIEKFVTSEEKASEAVSAKGSKEAKDRMAPCGATIDKVKSATCTPSGNNYKITIVMNEEVNPAKGSNGIASMSTGILYLEDVKNTIANDKTVSFLVKSLDDSSKITYKAYTITATITKDGKIIDMQHVVTGDIVAGAKLLVGSASGTGSLTFHSNWYNFKY